ncbi:hypothetical protein OF83DRAFT_408724 [Amylostereum chailletii]|nr:hypothetical protein OF83DRAFT_408724 [Amylostereum chailletii]
MALVGLSDIHSRRRPRRSGPPRVRRSECVSPSSFPPPRPFFVRSNTADVAGGREVPLAVKGLPHLARLVSDVDPGHTVHRQPLAPKGPESRLIPPLQCSGSLPPPTAPSPGLGFLASALMHMRLDEGQGLAARRSHRRGSSSSSRSRETMIFFQRCRRPKLRPRHASTYDTHRVRYTAPVHPRLETGRRERKAVRPETSLPVVLNAGGAVHAVARARSRPYYA